MRNNYNRQLEQLNDEIIRMGCAIENSIEEAVQALLLQDVAKARNVMASDYAIDRMEKDVENLCMKIILQQQPVATDLRTVSAALKMVTDMERIGDHATDISELTILLADVNDAGYAKKLSDIEKMASETMCMLNNSLKAYVNKDQKVAEAVIQRDDAVDDLFLKVKNELINIIRESPELGEQAADLLMIAKYFERIGDHATNIAEWAIFSITGSNEA